MSLRDYFSKLGKPLEYIGFLTMLSATSCIVAFSGVLLTDVYFDSKEKVLRLEEKIARIELEKAKIGRDYVPMEMDLNNNGKKEKFIWSNEGKYFLEVDGINLEELYFKRK